jgi:periplasmic copper chaperone A
MFRTTLLGAPLLGAAGVLAGASIAFAHITLENQQAPVGASYKAVLRVPHGCEGSATVAVRVRVPDGFIEVKPMPKPGWKLDVVRGKYQKPMSVRGTKVTEGVTEVNWSGGNLPDAYYDEFLLTGYIGDEAQPGQTMYFRVVQECEKGINRWIEIPAGEGGAPAAEPAEPAAALKLLPKR